MQKSSISQKQLREFGFLIGFGLPIIFGWMIPAITGHIFRYWTLWVGCLSLMLVILRPRLLFYPYKAWMTLGHALGWVNSRIILGLVFILVLQPIALVMKVFGYDPLRKKKCSAKSFRENKANHKINLTRIF